ncbi:HIT domain-containing protein [Arenibaculum pallidiluteum]|uniref:HIT domain-containing protein n=1 Tax=Arenibaculum pallidiluteum TaxID=2812559 RepID=UPI001A975782|nr:HIT domain-containing protein [Arenibaculum pallidiluteum]
MSSNAYQRLRIFLEREMRQSHIYQPVMIRTLLERGGIAHRRDIAREFLTRDRSQLEYYEQIVREMPGRVLANRGMVERDGQTYRLTVDPAAMTDAERADLIALCDCKVAAYLDARPDPWSHRRKSDGYIPGSLRYDVLKRAGGRCEACGISAEAKALEVDHIVPRNNGGSDDPSNLQALCYTCNAQKRDRDDTNFGAIRRSYDDRDAGCVFCNLPQSRIVAENELATAIRDGFPVTEGHTLVMPRRHVADYFDLHVPERNGIESLLHDQRRQLQEADRSIAGFNVGTNSGGAAGQTIFHVHVHLIPRRVGDVESPRGGVRGVIPARQSY